MKYSEGELIRNLVPGYLVFVHAVKRNMQLGTDVQNPTYCVMTRLGAGHESPNGVSCTCVAF